MRFVDKEADFGDGVSRTNKNDLRQESNKNLEGKRNPIARGGFLYETDSGLDHVIHPQVMFLECT